MYYKAQQPAGSTEDLIRSFGKMLPTQLMAVLTGILALQGAGGLSGYGCATLDDGGHSLQTTTGMGRIRVCIKSRVHQDGLFHTTGTSGIGYRLGLFLDARRVDKTWVAPLNELLNKILAVYGGYLTCIVTDNVFVVSLSGTGTRLTVDIKVLK